MAGSIQELLWQLALQQAQAAEVPYGQDDLLSSVRNGMQPFNPKTDKPQDVGLGGPSTEYLVGGEDPYGTNLNYPSIWWMGGKPALLDQDAAYDQTNRWEAGTGQMFPRYRNEQAAEFAARNRSATGGAEHQPLAGLYGYKNF